MEPCVRSNPSSAKPPGSEDRSYEFPFLFPLAALFRRRVFSLALASVLRRIDV